MARPQQSTTEMAAPRDQQKWQVEPEVGAFGAENPPSAEVVQLSFLLDTEGGSVGVNDDCASGVWTRRGLNMTLLLEVIVEVLLAEGVMTTPPLKEEEGQGETP